MRLFTLQHWLCSDTQPVWAVESEELQATQYTQCPSLMLRLMNTFVTELLSSPSNHRVFFYWVHLVNTLNCATPPLASPIGAYVHALFCMFYITPGNRKSRIHHAGLTMSGRPLRSTFIIVCAASVGRNLGQFYRSLQMQAALLQPEWVIMVYMCSNIPKCVCAWVCVIPPPQHTSKSAPLACWCVFLILFGATQHKNTVRDTKVMYAVNRHYWHIRGAVMSTMPAMQTHVGRSNFSQRKSSPPSLSGNSAVLNASVKNWYKWVDKVLTLKTRVAERFTAETFVILHSVDDDGPS